MLERIQEILVARELSASQFADAIGVSRPVVSHLLSGRNKPSLEVVQKILAAFPDLSMGWLLNGDGPMLARPTSPLTAGEASVTRAALKAEAPTKSEQPPVEPRAPAAAPPSPRTPTEPAAGPEKAATVTALSPQTPPDAPPALRPQAEVAAAPAPAGTEMAVALAEPGKIIRRIVLFYQDGTFTDFRPDTSN